MDVSPPYWDMCPEVCAPGPVPANRPTAVRVMDGGWYLANYRCPLCGYEWACSWSDGDYGPEADRFMRELAEATIARGVVMLPPGGRRYPQTQARSA